MAQPNARHCLELNEWQAAGSPAAVITVASIAAWLGRCKALAQGSYPVTSEAWPGLAGRLSPGD